MSFLDLVQQNHGIRFPTNSLCQLTTFIISHVPRRRPDQPRNRMTLLILGHINTGHQGFIVKQELCQCLRQLGFTDTRGSEEDKRPNGTFRIL